VTYTVPRASAIYVKPSATGNEYHSRTLLLNYKRGDCQKRYSVVQEPLRLAPMIQSWGCFDDFQVPIAYSRR
jgi:hypothetical protein